MGAAISPIKMLYVGKRTLSIVLLLFRTRADVSRTRVGEVELFQHFVCLLIVSNQPIDNHPSYHFISGLHPCIAY